MKTTNDNFDEWSRQLETVWELGSVENNESYCGLMDAICGTVQTANNVDYQLVAI